jgi:F-type H+-transporting ATPase subunit delta
MADRQAGKRYAQAAFEIATRDGTAAAWRSDLADIAEVLAESAAAPIFHDPKVPLERKLAIVDRVLEVQPLAANFAKVLIQKGRAPDARVVEQAFGRLADEAEGIAHAAVTTAVELTPAQLSSIEQRLSESLGKRVRATGSVDPALLGGLVVRVGDQLVDGSIRTRLRRLRRELEGVR